MGNLNTVPDGETYLEISDRCRRLLAEGKAPFKNFPELSYLAWKVSEQVNEERRSAAKGGQSAQAGEAIGDQNVPTIH